MLQSTITKNNEKMYKIASRQKQCKKVDAGVGTGKFSECYILVIEGREDTVLISKPQPMFCPNFMPLSFEVF